MNHLTRVFPIYAQMISGEVGVNVVIGGERAYFNGQTRTIHLPALDLSDSDIAEAAWGYQYHESFHASDSNMELIAEVVADNPFRKKMLNIVEDLWVEREQPERYQTAKEAIDAMNTLIWNEKGFEPSSKPYNPGDVFARYVLLQGIGYHNNLDVLHENADKQRVAFLEVFSRSVLTRLNALLGEYLPKISSTEDSLAITDEIIKMLEDEIEDDDTDDSSDDSGADSDDSSDDSGADSDDSSDDSGAGSDDSSDDSGADSDDSSDDSAQVKANIKSALSSSDEDLPDDKSGVIEQLLNDAPKGNYQVAKPTPTDSEDLQIGDHSEDVYGEALKESGALSKHFQRLLQDAYLKKQKLKQYGVKIARNRMSRAMFGDNKVFLHPGRKQMKETSFHLLIDLSGSMSRNVMTTLSSAMALGLALERVKGAEFAISRFPVCGYVDGVYYNDDVQPLLRAGERVAEHLDRFNICVQGTTPLADAMWFAYGELEAQSAARKILIVLTDGMPDSSDSVKQVYNEGSNLGIETVAIGIQSDAADKLFDVAERIDDISDLETALFEIATNALIAA